MLGEVFPSIIFDVVASLETAEWEKIMRLVEKMVKVCNFLQCTSYLPTLVPICWGLPPLIIRPITWIGMLSAGGLGVVCLCQFPVCSVQLISRPNSVNSTQTRSSGTVSFAMWWSSYFYLMILILSHDGHHIWPNIYLVCPLTDFITRTEGDFKLEQIAIERSASKSWSWFSSISASAHQQHQCIICISASAG